MSIKNDGGMSARQAPNVKEKIQVARSYLDKTAKKDIGRYRLNQDSVLASSSVDQASLQIPGFDAGSINEMGSQLSLDRDSGPNQPAMGHRVGKRKSNLKKNNDISHVQVPNV